jgi:hypothetical protein
MRVILAFMLLLGALDAKSEMVEFELELVECRISPDYALSS